MAKQHMHIKVESTLLDNFDATCKQQGLDRSETIRSLMFDFVNKYKEAVKMEKYYIDYGTGAGNEWVEGSIDEAKKAADDGATYTQCDIVISDENEDEIIRRKWYGYKLSEDDDVTDPIEFGDFGFYDDWR